MGVVSDAMATRSFGNTANSGAGLIRKVSWPGADPDKPRSVGRRRSRLRQFGQSRGYAIDEVPHVGDQLCARDDAKTHAIEVAPGRHVESEVVDERAHGVDLPERHTVGRQ